MPGRMLIKTLAKVVVGAEYVRHALRKAFARRITVVQHLAILREVIDGHEADKAASCETIRDLTEEVESLKAANKNLQANAVSFQTDNADLRNVIANAEAVLRWNRHLPEKKPS